MKIYTKTGDDGSTALFDGSRTLKCDDRVDLYGEVDELNAAIGLALSVCQNEFLKTHLTQVQKDLFSLGSKLANPKDKTQKEKADFDDNKITVLEKGIDKMDAELPAMTSFILPGGTTLAAHLHLCRCICRRVERKMVFFGQKESLKDLYIQYINRLSDFLFVCARYANLKAGIDDIPW